jgi:Uma2 family endonuclease
MSSILENPSVSASALRLQVDQYHQLCASGIIPERTELLSGIIVQKMGKSPLHTWTVQFLADWLREQTDNGQTLRVEQPLTLGDSEPEPDLAVVSGNRDDFVQRHPTEAELVIEVAISTIELDREKAKIYAAANVPEYWLVMPEKNQVIAFNQPSAGTYLESKDVSDELRFGESTLSFTDLFRLSE